ncbi:MAG: UbiA prenyltransferase family protein [Turicibacter sp.]|nr:UbiA prenyltransferase family protein [Turicibacter sp.]
MLYFKLLRVNHYLKNLLIFLPLIFSINFFNLPYFILVATGFLSFSLLASAIYIINDIKDRHEDAMHPTKKMRPISSGEIPIRTGISIGVFLLAAAFIGGLALFQIQESPGILIFPFLYLLNNYAYTFKIKQIPILDVLSIAVGFLFRVMFGASIINVPVSPFLYLTILTLAFYMGYGKRRGEYKAAHQRKSLQRYSLKFLEKNMTMCVTLAIVFYVMWTLALSDDYMILMVTTPLILLILMRYNFILEGQSDGDPIEVVIKDRLLFGSVAAYGGVLITLLYV